LAAGDVAVGIAEAGGVATRTEGAGGVANSGFGARGQGIFSCQHETAAAASVIDIPKELENFISPAM
jgi:hypothetical protein